MLQIIRMYYFNFFLIIILTNFGVCSCFSSEKSHNKTKLNYRSISYKPQRFIASMVLELAKSILEITDSTPPLSTILFYEKKISELEAMIDELVVDKALLWKEVTELRELVNKLQNIIIKLKSKNTNLRYEIQALRRIITNIEGNPNIRKQLSNAYFEEAKFLLQKEKYSKAIDFLSEALRLNPSNKIIEANKSYARNKLKTIINTMFLRGQTYFMQNRLNDAIVEFDKVLEKDPKNKKSITLKNIALKKLLEPIKWTEEVELLVLNGHKYNVLDLDYYSNGNKIVSVSSDHTIKVWNSNTGENINSLRWNRTLFSVDLSPDDKYLVASGGNGFVGIWNTNKWQLIHQLHGHSDGLFNHIVGVALFSPNSKVLASGSDDDTVRIWDIKTGKQVHLLAEKEDVHAISFSPEGRYLATANKNIHLWKVSKNGKLYRGGIIRTFTGHRGRVESLAFAPGGGLIASGGWDKTAKIWDVNTGVHIKELSGHTGWVTSVAFSPDGHILASGSEDNMIRLWNVKTGGLVRVLTGHTDNINTLKFSPDGESLASASSDSTIRIWNLIR